MKLQEFIANQTAYCCEALITQAEALGEKATWAPEGCRNAHDQIAECAIICGHMPQVLQSRTMPDFSPEMMAEYEKAKASLATMAEAVALLRENNAKLVSFIQGMSDSDLDEEMKFWGPKPWIVADVADHHRWNMVYHTGQICYIQTLLGDKDMH